MPAYLIATREKTHIPAELDIYNAAVPSTLAGRGATPRAFYGKFEVLEGPATEGVVIMEFPSMEAARDWYNSSAYRQAAEHRRKGSDYRFILVEGV